MRFAVVMLLAGFAHSLSETIWASAKRPYIDPVNGPRPRIFGSAYLGALAVALIGGLLGLIARFVLAPQLPLGGALGEYLGAATVGAALAIMLTAKGRTESYNKWLASTSPMQALDFRL